MLYRDVKSLKNRARRATNIEVRNALINRYLLQKKKLELTFKIKSEISWKQYICDGDNSEAKNWGNGYRFIKLRLKGKTQTQTNRLFEGERTNVVNRVRLILERYFPSITDVVTTETNTNDSYEAPILSIKSLAKMV